MSALIQQCDNYLGARTGKYEWRAVRYREAAQRMCLTRGLENADTLVDVAAGWTELDYCLRTDFDWRGRYLPIDGGLDGTDLNTWEPPRTAEWFVALEIVEHLHDWRRLVAAMKEKATKGIIISTPNPETTDVLGMDPTHVVEVHSWMLARLDFTVLQRTFYGQPCDSLFAYWLA